MNSVIKKSRTTLASFLVGAVLVGCGGGGSGESDSVYSNGQGVAGGLDTATLSWNAPATRVNGDGLAMGELKGYVIRYGQQADDLDNRIEIGDASVMDYTVGGLGNGSWYFTIQVVDVDGLVSAPSEVVSKTI
ncbi:fibronectin type III domain-containing protein [Marinobacter mobilis]|uniref:Fibronectin type-III domain-containing protein n=1 Tax=Marinobacter mobilis TaxID=488533 RepID=A0A1H3DGY7_9GAMM|nr:fibronectin type III domain-containing protein [Marinobacter mobilis]SDX64959.1 hypothetical protein SAMN04487960_11263 [Marinobacter mobilis]